VTFTVDIHQDLIPDFIGRPQNTIASRSAERCPPRGRRPTRCRSWTARAIGPAAADCRTLRTPSGAR
jgi:hypothetical protein